jgi:hypothetical protein
MAYIATAGDGSNFYNVNFAVGVKAPNKRDDVFLVQWMLHRVYADTPSLQAPPPGDIDIDGWIGRQTVQWILAFQRDVRRFGNACAINGRVDSARQAQGSISKAPYTILWLNSAFLAANSTVYTNPASDTSCPQELLNALANNTAAAGPYVRSVGGGIVTPGQPASPPGYQNY